MLTMIIIIMMMPSAWKSEGGPTSARILGDADCQQVVHSVESVKDTVHTVISEAVVGKGESKSGKKAAISCQDVDMGCVLG